MTPRQRFQAIMRFEPPDRIPFWTVEGITEGAVRRWIRDGHVPLFPEDSLHVRAAQRRGVRAEAR